MGALGPMSEAERRLEVLQSIWLLGLTQAQAAARAGVDVRSVRRWTRRYEAEGLEGLGDRPSVPHHQPGRLPASVEQAVLEFSKEHPTYGARKLRGRWVLERRTPVPSLSSFARILRRRDPSRGDSVAASGRAMQRFVRPTVNDLWQVDATEWECGDGARAVIVDLIDDHSRFLVGAAAMPALTDEHATLLLDQCFARHGAPRQLLSDNGGPFTGAPRRMVTGFERFAWHRRVHTIHGGLNHPQTQGKIERFHQTLKAELGVAAPRSLAELQQALDHVVHDYNHHRPHQALNDRTPAMAWRAGWHQRAHPEHTPDPVSFQRLVASNGEVRWSGWDISIGRRYAGVTMTCTEDDGKLFIHLNGELIRAVVLNEQRRHTRARPDTPPEHKTGHTS